uniref:DUF19 domain-containing protein n=1 Tax=Elaeophora elaphi TaxID=1147741 RepID=A0A0R3RMW9_9BILA
MNAMSASMRTCPRASTSFKERKCKLCCALNIPVTGNNNVCFTYGEEKFTDTIAGKRYPSKFVNLLRMGQYNSSVLKYSLGRHCAMNYAQTAKLIEECTINLSEKGFQYFCCCYNDQLSQCQKRAATFLRRDNSTLGPLFCASQKLEVAKIKSGQQTGNWSFQMTLEEINNAIEKPDKSAYCHTHVTSDNVIQLGTGNSLCEGVDTLDARLRPIIRTFCFSAEGE